MTHCGYLFRNARDLKNGTESWRSLNKNCRGRINVGNDIKSVSEQCHEPQPEIVEEKLFRAELKTRAVLTEEKPKSVILTAQRFLTVASGPTLPSYPSNQRLINRVRQEVQLKIEDDKN